MTRIIVYFNDSRKLEIVTGGNAEDVADNFREVNEDRIVGILDKDGDVVVINWNHVTYAYVYNEGDDEKGGENNG